MKSRRALVAMLVSACGAAPLPPIAEPTATRDAGVDAAPQAAWAHAHLEAPQAPFAPPRPPRQGEPWTAPDGTPTEWVSAIDDAVAHGMPDPRGCAYREVVLVAGSLWSNGREVATHAFVIPGEPASVIAWDGTVRPAVSIGEPADIDADLTAAFDSTDPRYCEGSDECLLAVPTLVAAALATRVGVPSMPARYAAARSQAETSAAPLVSWWSANLVEQAFYAYLRGADGEALHALAMADVARPPDPSAPIVTTGDVVALRPAIAAELSRRAIAGPHLVIDADQDDLSDVPLEILLGSLDQVDERQSGQPGGVDLADDPIVRAILARGEVAIDPLLDVLEHDAALTRSTHFFRDFVPTRTLLATYEVAYVAIANILDWSAYDSGCTGCDLTNEGEEARVRIAAAMRTYWRAHRSMTRPERMLAVLEDDDAGPQAWLQAAQMLVTSEREDFTRYGSMPGVSPVTCREGSTAMLGEPLRARTGPSVTEVLARRLDAMAVEDDYVTCDFAGAVFVWDAAGARDPIARLAARCIEASCSCRGRLVEATPSLLDTLAGAVVRDPTHATRDDLAVLVAHRDRPEVDRAVAALLSPRSRALASLSLDRPPSHFEWWPRGILALPEVRALVAARLRDRTASGSIRVRDGVMRRTYDGGWSEGRAPEGAPDGHWTARVCDDWAAAFAETFDDAPRFALTTSSSERNTQLRAMLAWLESTTFVDVERTTVIDPCDDL